MLHKIPQKAYKEKEKRNEALKAQGLLELDNLTPKLSYDLIKDLFRYKTKEKCGLLIEAEYVSKQINQLSDLEKYFQFKTLGGDIEPIELKPNAETKRLDAQSENFHKILKRLNFSIEKTNFSFSNPKFDGKVNVLAHDNSIKTKVPNKKRVIVQVKLTSFINEFAHTFGWDEEYIHDKEEILIEAIHLKLLAKYEWGIEDIPFYFMVFSKKNDWEYKLFKVSVSQERLQEHYTNLLSIQKYLDQTMISGWNPYPKYDDCRGCILSTNCKHFVDVPSVFEVNVL
jgi:hypothetical protein